MCHQHMPQLFSAKRRQHQLLLLLLLPTCRSGLQATTTLLLVSL
jgi:hypothetical protein